MTKPDCTYLTFENSNIRDENIRGWLCCVDEETEHLNLSGNQITVTGVRFILIQLKDTDWAPHLLRIDLDANPCVSDPLYVGLYESILSRFDIEITQPTVQQTN